MPLARWTRFSSTCATISSAFERILVVPPSERRTVLVTDAARGSALAVVRSLGRAGFRVIAADADPGAPALRSRYAAAARSYPSPAHSAAALCDALWAIVQAEKVDLVVPVTDLVLQPLAAERARFEAVTRLALPDPAALTVASDKQATLELARRLGVPVPESQLVETAEEALEAARQLGWPVVLKPRVSKRVGTGVESFEVTYAANESELEVRLRAYQNRTPLLLQRWVPGVGHGVELLLHEGRPLAAFQHRRLRELPVTGGASAYRESVRLDPNLYEQAVRLLAALRWTGLAMVEFRVGATDSRLMEINGRVWGSLPLALTAGVDFPRLWAHLLLDGEAGVGPLSLGRYRSGVRARDLPRDLMWIASVLRGRRRHLMLPFPPRRAALGALLGFLDPRGHVDAWAWDDPVPAALELPRAMRHLWDKRRAARAPLAPLRSGTL
jgi:predicted ATP-grasp superfamily ATP-dependent carboligase